jgi:hypothetical protein
MSYAYGEQLAGCCHARKCNLCRSILLPLFLCPFPVHLKVRDLITPLLNDLLIPGIILVEYVLLLEELKTINYVFLPQGACLCIDRGASAKIRAKEDMHHTALMQWKHIERVQFHEAQKELVCGLDLAYAEFDDHPKSEDLAWLAQKIAKQQLRTSIEVEASWHEIGDVAQRLLQRQFTGKAVLHLDR